MVEREIAEKGYAHPEKLVTTRWVEEHLEDTQNIRIVESDEDVLLYEVGHIPNAVKIDWVEELNDPLVRDYISAERFAQLMSEKGISPDTKVIFYGDKNNWWATYALWVFELFGHTNTAIMDGGRQKWEAEGRPMTKEVPSFPKTDYPIPRRDDTKIRAFKAEVEGLLERVGRGVSLIDVRSPGEYKGELLHMPDYPQEGALRGGHIPGAANVPWARAVREDGTFKSASELKEIYEGEAGLSSSSSGDEQVIAYCRIGERSSHTWFVLKYLLGYENVKNYDGSWTEWGNAVRAPIER
ncbi:MAG: sulfurtransferase [Rubrobacter sp.]|nr:sulfurtransferase [Rubrobacter sp.]